MATTSELTGSGRVARATRGIIWISFGAAVLVGVASVVFGAIAVIDATVTGRIPLILETTERLPAAADAGSASIVDGSFDRASVVVEGLSAGATSLAVISSSISILIGIALAVTMAVIAWRMLHPDPFRRSLSWTVALSGAIVLIGSVLAGGLGVLASWMAATELNGGEPGFWPIVAGFDPGPIALGLALLLVGLAFELGEKLQRDSAGLV